MNSFYQKSKTSIVFSYEHEGISEEHYSSPETKITHEIDGESNIQEVCVAFENFLLSCGYRLNPGETIGVVENCN